MMVAINASVIKIKARLTIIKAMFTIARVVIVAKAIINSRLLSFQKCFLLDFLKKDHYLIITQPIKSSN